MNKAVKLFLVTIIFNLIWNCSISQNTDRTNEILINGINLSGESDTFYLSQNTNQLYLTELKDDNPIDVIETDSTYILKIKNSNYTILFIHYEIEIGLDEYGQPTSLSIFYNGNTIRITEEQLNIDISIEEIPSLRIISVFVFDNTKELFYSLPFNEKLFQLNVLRNR
jgi:hypothetical protein